MATVITFIPDPHPFVVDFAHFRREEPAALFNRQSCGSLMERVLKLVKMPFACLKIFFSGLLEGGRATLDSSWPSFKYIVLGYYGSLWNFSPPSDIYLAAVKVFFWIAERGWCFVSNTAQSIYKQTGGDDSGRAVLKQFLSKELKLDHMVNKDLVIDVSAVAANVKVDDLLALFDQINFANPSGSGYMAPASRREGQVLYTVEELRESLRLFIKHVNGRVAFLGTPPAYDTVRLFRFYQQIENAVRFSIQKVTSEIAEFKRTNGDREDRYTPEASIQYRNLLENQARVALNLAIAGKHCGARYMGESVELYLACKGDSAIEAGSLKDSIHGVLTQCRVSIVVGEIQRHFGSDTHAYSNYMANLGPLLGIPGSQDVVEHLSADRLNRSLYLKSFCEKYTVDQILEELNKKVKTSQAFREKIFDWLRDQKGAWTVSQNLLPDFIQGVSAIREDHSAVECVELQRIATIASTLVDTEVALPESSGEEFGTDFFALTLVSNWCQENIQGELLERARAKQEMRDLFSPQRLGDSLRNELIAAIREKRALNTQLFQEPLRVFRKIDRMHSLAHAEPLLRIERDTAERIVKGTLAVERGCQDALTLNEQVEFLHRLNLEAIQRDGLGSHFWEWILVSQGVFENQV